MSSGERPIGAAKGKQSDTEALCQPPPPPKPNGCGSKRSPRNALIILSQEDISFTGLELLLGPISIQVTVCPQTAPT